MYLQQSIPDTRSLRSAAIAAVVSAFACTSRPPPPSAPLANRIEAAPGAQRELSAYEHDDTRNLVVLVDDAARQIETGGEAAFAAFSEPGSRWRHDDTYIFVVDLAGNMVVHADPTMVGRNELDLKDVQGRPIIRGLIDAATALPEKPAGWYHYEWPTPSGLLPRWKSSYVRLAVAPSGARFVVGSGVYDDRMERPFVVDMVQGAARRIEKLGEDAFPLLRDRAGPFRAKDAYVFVIDPRGVELANPAFPNLEGRDLINARDTQGKLIVRDMLAVVEARGSGWVDYLWPKPGENVSTRKSTYVQRARLGRSWVLVGSGVYLADAPRAAVKLEQMTAPELMAFVRSAAGEFARRGEAAFPEFRTRGSRWFHDDTYLFVWTADGRRVFHAADPTLEGQDARGIKDALGRPYGKMFLEVAASPSGEGWVHYMYPEPGNLFPTWKSSFVKRVNSPWQQPYLIGAGIYNMKMDRTFVVDVVDRAAALIAQRGRLAFDALRDPTGPYVFMDTYVFVDRPDGVELVNPAQPFLEGKSILDLRDVKGKAVAREYITAAMTSGAAWTEYEWYRPGQNTTSHKQAYVRRVQSGPETYIVGSGLYVGD